MSLRICSSRLERVLVLLGFVMCVWSVWRMNLARLGSRVAPPLWTCSMPSMIWVTVEALRR